MRESTINEEEGAPLLCGVFNDNSSSDHSIFFKTERSRRFLGIALILIAMTVITTPFMMDFGAEDNMIQLPNVDLVDVNGPPAAELANKRGKKSRRKKKSYLTREPLLIVDNNNDEVPSDIWASAVGLHASDALECRQSVINFVINATDGKDECNGLKRAFDKTCNADSPVDVINKQHQRRRRLMVEKITSATKIKQRYQIFIFETIATIRHGFESLMPTKKKNGTLFIEDLLVGQAYKDAKYIVENDLENVVHRSLTTEDTGQQSILQGDNSAQHRQEEYFGEDHSPAIAGKVNTSTHVIKPRQSLTLPTSNQHISDKMLSDTLMLQKEDTIDLARKSIADKTQNLTGAAADAVTSSKAIHDTAEAVSAVLNDPTSIEARVCCASILNVFHELCDTPAEERVSDRQLFLIVAVLALCGMVKSMIRHFKIRWLPEAAGCILVGVLCGAVVSFFPHTDISFDGEWFLRIMVPPIVFEAALSIDKRSFNRHIVPIMFYAVIGTVVATVITALIVHQGSFYGGRTIPVVESLTFGALISSIDPIAVLSVLSNMGLSDTDTIYVVIFGESLLNDGVALVLYETLVHFLDESLVIDNETVFWAVVHFFVVAFGSLCIGIGSGLASAAYYYVMQGCQNGITEVLLFFCWAFIPYYVSDGIGWSGIVTVVATGFVMDLYVVGQPEMVASEVSQKRPRRKFFSMRGHLSTFSKAHVHFVAELLAAVMETAIFSYLGLFLFSYRYHWNFLHIFLSILACVVSRAIMIPMLSLFANCITKMQQNRDRNRNISERRGAAATAGVTIDRKMQMVLWAAGLRGAMSFALVENIPLYDAVTGEGSKVKAELKAMTSASIVFTVFFLGGYTSYLMEHLGITLPPNDSSGRGMRRKASGNYLHGVENDL